ncbi:hypothetical protein [Burkholderia seminalis]|uniref:Stationary phase growth adaptation protein n=1 Tax=Burkholderia cenocepacia TaxID=95486 RepID=A0A071MAD6_9BURK|nr:hypothetical protein [Burkholderia seminalis]AOJ25998.1 hypothetical protein WJ12_14665 [Burkholderia seminalis]KVF47096.1 hypothetical protein WJ13_21615 [Burkholderia seminalis]MCA8041889.1 hypothetical protein [Burkholderia seminalis]MDN7853286.1 hypothetical protein [Burkholderia seminalis]QTO18440.1 hypothetical protein DT99_015300 [Burkholderia seminalis]
MPNFEIRITETPLDAASPFPPTRYRGEHWDLNHLRPLTFTCDLETDFDVTVLVLFSCHCFTRSFKWDGRPRDAIPDDEIYDDGRETRVLCADRYRASRQLLRDVIVGLATRRIVVADERQPNFVTVEAVASDGTQRVYAVFFEVSKDRIRKRRLILRVQSAYMLDGGLNRRQREARKVALRTLLRASLEGRRIRA